MTTKICTKCLIEKPLTEFSNAKATKDGKMYVCKECNRKTTSIYRLTYSGMYSEIKARNKHYKTHEWDLGRKEFLSWCDDVSYSCSYCDMPDYVLPIFAKKYGGRYKRFTLDCKDNSLGYRIDNITWACDRCNTIKSDILSFDEARKLSQEYIKPKWQELLEENLL